MSRFKLSRLCMSIEPERIALVKIRRGFRRHIEADRIIAVDDMTRHPGAALEALSGVLAEQPWRDSSVQIILSNTLIKTLVVEVVPGIETADELQLAIGIRIAEAFGLVPAEWEISASIDPFGQRILACAAERRLIQGLRQVLAAAKCELVSIQPFVVTEFNRWRRCVGKKSDAWFGVVEPNSLTLAYIADSHWQGICTYRNTSSPHATLATALRRDRLTYDLPESMRQVWLSGSSCDMEASEVDTTADIHPLGTPLWPGRSESWSHDFRLALSPFWP